MEFAGMIKLLSYQITLPPLAEPNDVEIRLLTVTVDGDEKANYSVPPGQLTIDNVKIVANSAVSLSLIDIDDALNKSEPSVYEFTAVDTFPPAKPGEFAIRATGEELLPAPDPTPE
jgi:hypothetical protein